MKQKAKKHLALLTALIFATAFTACSRNASGEAEDANTSAVSSSAPVSSESSAETSEQTETEKTTQSETQVSEIIYNPDMHIEIFSSELKENGEKYKVRAFLFDRIEKIDDETVRGDLAIELSKNGEWINTIVPPLIYMSQYTIIYSKDNFNVIELEGGEVLSASYFQAGNANNELGITCFFCVSNGRLCNIERFYTEEEKKQIELDGPHSHTDSEWLCFHTGGSFTQSKNTLTFTLDKEITKNETVYPAGEITLKFDFENNTVQCEKEEYQGLVYHY